MPKINDQYDIGKAFEAIENDLIASMIRNLRRHKQEEVDEKKQWTMWQAEQLKALEKYKKLNQKKYGQKFKDINKKIRALISIARSEGEMEQEIAILEAIKKGFPAKRISKGAAAEFFKLNERKLEALIKATMNDMKKAETAVLRMANDQYRKAIFNAQVYLQKSNHYIKKQLISIFDATGEISKLSGDYAVALADIYDVFSGESAKGIRADIIGIFSDAFLGVLSLGTRFVGDVLNIIVTPVTNNVGKIKEAFENTLNPIEVVLDTFHTSVTHTFEKMSQIYDEYVKPFLDSIAEGISSITGTLLDAYNTYIAPVLDSLAEKFSTVYAEHVQPMLDKVVELFGKIAENLQALWETALVPFIEWIINTIIPQIAPVLETLGTLVLNFMGTVSDVIGGIVDILSGFIEFCTGAFTGDFDKCFSGLAKIAIGFRNSVKSIIGFIRNSVFEPFDNWLSGVFEKDWTDSFGVLGNGLNAFFKNVKNIWEDIKKVFNGVVEFIEGIFSGNWKQAWEGIKNIFAGVFEGLTDIARTPINAIIGAFNAVIDVVNGVIGKINSIRFTIDIPDWMGGGYWGFNGFNIPSIGKIPYLAQGGFVEKNTPQLAMIGDNRHQGEVVAPEDKLREMAMEAVKAAGGSGITRDELERIINNAVMRIVAALASLGFYIDGEHMAKAMRAAAQSVDSRFNPVEAT